MADSKRARSWKRRTLPRIDLTNDESVLYSTSDVDLFRICGTGQQQKPKRGGVMRQISRRRVTSKERHDCLSVPNSFDFLGLRTLPHVDCVINVRHRSLGWYPDANYR